MEHPFEYRAHFGPTGQVCHCPWGHHVDPEHLGSVKEASKLEWLEGRPDMQTPEGQEFLKNVRGRGGSLVEDGTGYNAFSDFSKADKMLPWMAREWKKKRLTPPDKDGPDWGLGGFTYQNHKGENKLWTPGAAEETEKALEEMQKHRKGIDVMQHKVHELVPKVQDWKDSKQAEQREHLGEPLHQFDNGWSIRQLQNRQEMEDEGRQMGHCIGTNEYGCPQRHEEGKSVFASLRDHRNMPHATIELKPDHYEYPPQGSGWNDALENETHIPRVGPTSSTRQFYGKEDSAPIPEYEDKVNQWLHAQGAPAAEGGGQYDDNDEANIAQIQPAENIQQYLDIHGVGNWENYTLGTDNGEPIGEMTEPEYDHPNMAAIAHDWLTSEPRSNVEPQMKGQEQLDLPGNTRYPAPDAQPASTLDRENFVRELSYEPDHREAFENQLQTRYDPLNNPDPRKTLMMEEYQQMMQKEKERQMAQGRREYNPDLTYLFSVNPEYPKWDSARTRGEYGVEPTKEGPYPNYYNYSRTAAPHHRPLYFRWVYSPHKGVTVNNNQEAHPTKVKYHGDLGGDINDTDLTHGYASALDGGWRITDLAHQPVEDPYIVNQVVRRLNLEDGPQIRSEGSWQPSEYDFDRLHYGLPAELAQN